MESLEVDRATGSGRLLDGSFGHQTWSDAFFLSVEHLRFTNQAEHFSLMTRDREVGTEWFHKIMISLFDIAILFRKINQIFAMKLRW